MKTKGKIYSLALVICLIGFLLVARGEAQENVTLSLQDAVKLGLENSNEAQLAKKNLEEAQVTFQEGKATLLLSPSVIQELSLQNTWKLAQRNYEMTLTQHALSVEEGYYNVLKAEQSLELAQNNLKSAENQYQNIRTKYSLGMVAEIDLLSTELELNRAKNEIQNSQRALSLAQFQFNQLIGNRENKNYQLSDKLNFQPLEVNLEESLEYALAHRLEIEQARDNVTLKEKEVEVNSNPYTPPLTLQKSKVQLAQAQINLENTQSSIILEVRKNYSTLKDAEELVPLQAQSSKIAQEKLRIAQAQFDAGLITTVDLLDEQNNTYEADTAYLQAVFDYRVAQATFFTSLGMSLEERPKTWQENSPEQPTEEQPAAEE
ncbi:MAG: TolC family protein [Candidatus Atribacteria bacterium]|nr:TolC family protein [Candidatus Atribacteria bacterium]